MLFYIYILKEAPVVMAGVQLVALIDFSLALIFISGRGSAISSAKQGKSGSIYNLVKNKQVAWAAQRCVHFMKINRIHTELICINS